MPQNITQCSFHLLQELLLPSERTMVIDLKRSTLLTIVTNKGRLERDFFGKSKGRLDMDLFGKGNDS